MTKHVLDFTFRSGDWQFKCPRVCVSWL